MCVCVLSIHGICRYTVYMYICVCLPVGLCVEAKVDIGMFLSIISHVVYLLSYLFMFLVIYLIQVSY